jgi:hypothetical protein
MNRNAAELLEAMDAEDERQREALRLFYQREREPIHFTGKDLLLFLLKVLVAAGAVGLFVYWSFRIPLP